MKYRYAEMVWSEIKEAAQQERVAVLPVGTHEDHGLHLPVDADVLICTEICERAVAQIPAEAVLVPPVIHGYSPHHMDFPGPITISWDTFIKYVKDVCCSLAHHDFKRILMVNGHGSNTAPLELAARQSIIEYEGKILCALVNHWEIRKAKEMGNKLRESDHGGVSHAGEYETSIYLALKPDLLDMNKAVDERSPLPPSFQADLLLGANPEGSAAHLMPYWSSMTESGVRGDATKASVEKGKNFLEAAIEGLIELIREFKVTKILPRKKH
ncbi:MAG: creatininase family protein [Candidatus Aminicenantes bacterium]|nr:creatininase family protein [Candidatus Aminicenantes bacterium]NIM84645.1 creatininase family protein [Candidatus Aminicenantes bacterium]NIN24150.1 creatininase family protein [Candidatus Aminicenantes bacterium]NIN47874.1 creatininase family protein [Candidatus Aminicenantes bacterium]NIN90812.1 creatininase family protein [Candidatus Aminicenantes bacterium]